MKRTLVDLRLAPQPALPEPCVRLRLETIEDGQHRLTPDTTYLVVCEHGSRAALAARFLRADGLQAEAWKGTPQELEATLPAGS